MLDSRLNRYEKIDFLGEGQVYYLKKFKFNITIATL